MAEDKILVTDLINAVGNQALSLIHCEPFIKWVLEKALLAIEHDTSAILLAETNKATFYLWFNRAIDDSYLRDFQQKSISALNAAIQSNFSEVDAEVIAFNEGEISAKNKAKAGPLASFYSAPLVVRGNTLGVFTISSAQPDLFLVYRLNMFNVFTNQVALAIDSLKAREQVVRQMRIIERDRTNMQNAFSGMSEGLIMTDESDQLILLNPTARRMLGLKEDAPDTIPADFAHTVLSALFQELSHNDKLLATKEIDVEKPHKMTLRIDATPAIDSQGKRIGTVVLLRDVTIEKEIDRLKSEFISTVSHELRTPLTTIRESVSQVLDGILGATTPEQKEFLSICLEDIDRLTRIINDLLDISKIEARKIVLKKEVVDIVEVAKAVSFIFLNRAKEKGLEIRTNFSAPNAEIYADKDKLIQVFTNLIGNSLKFTQKGHIEISVSDRGEDIECAVSDTGQGISAEDLPKVFSKFQQFGRVSGPGERGTGLGLSIAKGIVELHHGTISVESRFNQWTKFIFRLPKYSSEGVILETIDRQIAEAKKENKEFSLLVIALDNAERIKEEEQEIKWHAILLKTVEAFKKVIRADDFIIPKGENEILVLAGVGKTRALEMQERFRSAAKDAAVKIGGREFKINFSFASATYPIDADNARDLLRQAHHPA